MWIDPLFAADARSALARLVTSQSLATVVVAAPLRAAHLPLLLEDDGGSLALAGHVPVSDPLSQAVVAGERLLCVFHGPRAYVSAGWYASTGCPRTTLPSPTSAARRSR